MVSAILLAAGESHRMGRFNKLLLPFGESTLIEQVVDALIASRAGELVVVVGHEAEKVRELLKKRKIAKIIENSRFPEGMTSSIQTGVPAASQESDGWMICLSDQPFVKTSEYDRLLAVFEAYRKGVEPLIVVPTFEGQRGNPVLFSREFRKTILQHQGEGGRGILQKHPHCVREVEMESDHVLRDIDTKEDYERFLFRATS